ncbi:MULTISPECIES: hypothetical protein [unclassified Microbacterium]|uniref:hypothetical protein n=1 Tax=unclassified Microbacterium TaxID=2609290 RepID=UPI00214B65D7|nr:MULTISPECIES: hypothetical protein [unclassified Microbacterium]MCR2808334.1 hypothetical protein [Microbacterium sp. zg.B185]WIM19214.1 hypothetical protein QNO12_16840 [Microbacterium sp. zg-B185]
MITTRKRRAAALLGMLAMALVGCSAPGVGPAESDGPTGDDVVPALASFDHGVAALPSADELPAGFVMERRCPGGEYCGPISDHDEVMLLASMPVPPEVVEPEGWGGTYFTFRVAVYSDAEAAQEALAGERDRAAERTGDFDIAPGTLEDGFTAGETGTGESGDIEIAGWEGVQGLWTSVLTAPDGDPSAERHSALIAIVHDAALIACSAQRYAIDAGAVAEADCAEAVADYLERLAAIDPADAPRVTTVSRLAAALPAEGDLPAGHEVSVRCPGDPECEDERQDQDASLSVDLALPAGVTPQGDGPDRFRVQGGEWSENFWLRAYIQSDEAAAQAAVAERTGAADALVGELDTPATKTDYGYDYGVKGRGEIIDIAGEGWTGRLTLFEARFVHLDGRIGDPRFDIRGAVSGGDVLLVIESSFTVEGRDQADAVGTVEAQIAGFFDRLAAAP